ncbi:unnamed protein product [Meloidogyne enterolobii]|uniref:Uncharacterized protein n=2 Tax=Meloidogyne enterolobii TaxID=390850 RepID=A0ACB0YQ98_MELEN|nr:unnamed protein product [Meloidogyne enterolobii]
MGSSPERNEGEIQVASPSPDSIRGPRPSPNIIEGETSPDSSSPDSVRGTRTSPDRNGEEIQELENLIRRTRPSPEIIEEEIQEERPPPVIIDITDPCGTPKLITMNPCACKILEHLPVKGETDEIRKKLSVEARKKHFGQVKVLCEKNINGTGDFVNDYLILSKETKLAETLIKWREIFEGSKKILRGVRKTGELKLEFTHEIVRVYQKLSQRTYMFLGI